MSVSDGNMRLSPPVACCQAVFAQSQQDVSCGPMVQYQIIYKPRNERLGHLFSSGGILYKSAMF